MSNKRIDVIQINGRDVISIDFNELFNLGSSIPMLRTKDNNDTVILRPHADLIESIMATLEASSKFKCRKLKKSRPFGTSGNVQYIVRKKPEIFKMLLKKLLRRNTGSR